MHLHHSKTRRKSLLQLELVIFLLSTLLCCTYSLMCYECFDTGPTNLNCTRQDHNCTGSACILYESGDNKTSSAFCLLTTFSLDSAGDANAAHPPKNGCWMEADGQGKHCICSTDFCNRLRDRTHKTIYDSTASPLPELEFLKQNPFIDYEYIEDERSISDGPISKSKNSSQTYHFEPDSLSDVDHEDESDLVPVDFDAYQDEWLKRGNDSLSADPSPTRSFKLPVDNSNAYQTVPTEGRQENSAFRHGPASSFTMLSLFPLLSLLSLRNLCR